MYVGCCETDLKSMFKLKTTLAGVFILTSDVLQCVLCIFKLTTAASGAFKLRAAVVSVQTEHCCSSVFKLKNAIVSVLKLSQCLCVSYSMYCTC